MATTIRVNNKLHNILKELSDISGKTMQSVLEEMLEKHRREILLIQHNKAFSSLSEEEWREEKEERQEWENTLNDDLGVEND